jgi:restriction system protein
VILALAAVRAAIGWVIAFIKAKRKPCPHGVTRGKKGGCQLCIAEEERRQAEWQMYSVVQERKKAIRDEALVLRDSELKRLRRGWLSKSELYLRMNSREFEDAIAALFRELGYEVKQTPYSNDRGKDAVAWKDGKKFLIECKRYEATNPIGRRELQIFVAAMKEENAQGGFYVNTGRFASTAPEYAGQNQIELYDRARLPELVNRACPVSEDVSTAKVRCLECGAVQELPIAEAPTFGICIEGHRVTNDITTGVICSGFAPKVCKQCSSEMQLVSRGYRKVWRCPKCREALGW